MKRTLSSVLILVFILSLAACGKADNNPESSGNENGADKDMKILITIGGNEFTAKLYDNETARALAGLLPMTLHMSELNNNEKYHYLPDSLPVSSANPGTIQAGDIMLYGANCLVLFYKTFSTSFSYTKIGRIENTSGLSAALGSAGISITFSAMENN